MSELITNLQTIYNTKLAIKEAIGTVSDDFVQYPSYISSMVTPTGTYNISDNGTFDVSTYASAYVNVSGGGADYTWVDGGSHPSLSAGDKVSMNGVYNDMQTVIDSTMVAQIPELEPYIGYYLSNLEGSTLNNYLWMQYFVSETDPRDTGLVNAGVVINGEAVGYLSAMGANLVVIESINATNYAGGNLSYNISNNGTYDVTKYSSAVVNIGANVLNVTELSNISTETNNVSVAGKINKTYDYFIGNDGTMSSTICYISNLEDAGLSHNHLYILTGDYYPNGYMLTTSPELYVTNFKLI